MVRKFLRTLSTKTVLLTLRASTIHGMTDRHKKFLRTLGTRKIFAYTPCGHYAWYDRQTQKFLLRTLCTMTLLLTLRMSTMPGITGRRKNFLRTAPT